MKSVLTVLLLSLILVSAGCAMNGYSSPDRQNFTESRKFFDLTFAWTSSISGNSVTIEGIASNNRYPLIRDLELWIEMVDNGQRVRAKQVHYFIPVGMPQDSSSDFSVRLDAVPQKGDRLRFIYRYKAVEGNDEQFRWMNSFDFPLP